MIRRFKMASRFTIGENDVFSSITTATSEKLLSEVIE